MLKFLNPFAYDEIIAKKTFWSSVGFLLILLLIFTLIASFIRIKDFLALQNYLSKQIEKIDTSKTNWSIETLSPIAIPEKNPIFVFDTSGEKKGKFITISKTNLNFFNKNFKLEAFKDFKANAKDLGSLATYLIIFALPSIFFYWYLALFLKYFLIALTLGFVVWLLLDFTPYNIQIRSAFGAAFHSLIVLIPIELIFSSLGAANLLIPIFKIFEINFFLISLIIYILFFLIAMLSIVVEKIAKVEK